LCPCGSRNWTLSFPTERLFFIRHEAAGLAALAARALPRQPGQDDGTGERSPRAAGSPQPDARLVPGRLGNQRHVDHARSSPCAKLRSPLAKRRILHTTLGRLRSGVARGIVIFQRMALKSTLENDTNTEPNPNRQLTVVPSAKPPRLSRAIAASIMVPAIVADPGDAAAERFLEFFAVTIRNKNTRTAYLHAASRFFAWCEHHRLGALDEIEPLHVAAYIEALGKDFEKPTVKQHLAAIRMLFDWLVTGQVVATNPAHAVRGPRHVVKTGKTTVLDADQARKLLDSIDTSTVVGLRDRALIRR
jgi:Phage integrase, N-terminal SAM-like domain